MPSIAVVIPAYNAAPTLGKTLQSVLSQTLGDFEVIVTDDGSSDSTYDVAASFATRDARLKVVRQPNSGLADARNTGIRHTSAPLVAALDSDDVWHPTFLEKLSAAIQRGGRGTAVAYANSRIIDMDDRVLRNAPSFDDSGWALNRLLLENFIGNGSAMMFRRELALQVGAYDRRLHYEFGAQGCEDWLLALRLAAHGRVAAVREYLVGYRAVSGAMSENTLRMRRSRLYALEVLFSEVDPDKLRAGRWALGTSHAKCFLHELKALRLPEAATSLLAAIRLDFLGASRLLFGAERIRWLTGRIPELRDPEPGRSFWELDPREGQIAKFAARLSQAGQWDMEGGRVAGLDPEDDARGLDSV